MSAARPQISIVGLGGAVGSTLLSVEELSTRFGLATSRITEKTGITGLRRFGDGESLVGMAAEVAVCVLSRAGATRADVRGVFGSSNPTSEDLLPTFTAAAAQRLGLANIIVDHIGLGCCGGLQAIRNAHNQLIVDALGGRTGCCLVIVGDQTSRILDPDRRQTGTLFGEAVSVALLSNDPDVNYGYAIERVSTKSLLGDALFSLRLRNPFAVANATSLPRLEMDGPRVFEFGANAVEEFRAMLELEQLPSRCYVVPHQANLRMLEAMIARSNLDPAQVYVDGIRTIGNTSGPAAMLGLEDALRRKLVADDAPVLLGAFGAELQLGAALLRPLDPQALVLGAPHLRTGATQ